nr:hypothetical protein BDOA9_0202790 [Bradyrhizobium sp. DOA9]
MTSPRYWLAIQLAARAFPSRSTHYRLAAVERWHCYHLRRGLSLRRVLLQVGQLQLELLQQCAALGGCPNYSRRDFLIVSLSFSISKLPAWPRLPRPTGPLARRAASPAARSQRRKENRPCPSPTRESQGAVFVRTADRAPIQIPAISQPPAVVRSVVAFASGCPPAVSQAGLG